MTERSSRATEIAYYSMEVALYDRLPTFSGGLGVLAGDHLRAAADRGLPLVAVTLVYRHGFFRQEVREGAQVERPVEWDPSELLTELDTRVVVPIAGRRVAVKVWRLDLEGVDGHLIRVHFLDTDVEENAPEDRLITDRLYTADPVERLKQEAVLGLGGPLMLQALGYRSLRAHHVNEGHGSLVPVALLAERLGHESGAVSCLEEGLPGLRPADVAPVLRSCVFTTHTPVPAGHDRFDPAIARAVLGDRLVDCLAGLGALEGGTTLNMTVLGMRFSGFVNGVSLRHRDVTRAMFPGQPVEAITNGVHTVGWAAPATAALFDRYLPDWRRDSRQLHYAYDIPLAELREAHQQNKAEMCREVRRRCGVPLVPDALTIGVARRFAAYKRNDLILSDPERLAALTRIGPIQIVFAGKAHPSDPDGKAMLSRVVGAASDGVDGVTVAFVEDYGMELGRLLCAGSDVWLNNPTPPFEASGTSGMKAALNGVPSVSTADGWWLEGRIDGVTGWTIGASDTVTDGVPDDDPARHAASLFALLGDEVVPAYYKQPDGVLILGRNAIALNGSFFSAQRMVDEYARRAYGLVPGR